MLFRCCKINHHRAIITVAIALTTQIAVGDPTTRPLNRAPLPFGTDCFDIPPAPVELNIPPGTIELLSKAIKNMTGPSRLKYLKELGTCGEQALPEVLPHLQADDPLERVEAIQAVATIRTSPALRKSSDTGRAPFSRLLQPCLIDPDPEVRRETVVALSRLGDNSAITSALSDGDSNVQRAALRAAATTQQGNRITAMLPDLAGALLPVALDAIARCGDPASADAVAKWCNDPGPGVRAAAVRALGKLKASNHRDSVIQLLNDSFPTVRREATTALAGVAPTAVQQHFAMLALTDSDDTVKEAGAALLIDAPTTTAVDALLRQLPTDYRPLHNTARAALVAIGQPIVPLAVKLCDSKEGREQIDGAWMLGQLKSPAAMDRRIELLDVSDWSVAAAVVNSLSTAGALPDTVGPHLLKLIQRDQNDDFPSQKLIEAKVAAMILAGRVRYTPALPVIVPLIPFAMAAHPTPPDIQHAAIWAVGAIAPSPESAAARAVVEVHESAFQATPAVFESLKAIINMSDLAAVNYFRGWKDDPYMNGSNDCRWMAHLGYDFGTGKQTPWIPKPEVHTPDSISVSLISP